MKLLYIGPFFLGSTANHRVNGLRKLGLDVCLFDTDRYFPTLTRGIHCFWRRLCWGPPVWCLNTDIISEAERLLPDIVMVDKGLMIHSHTLRKLKNLKAFLIHYSHDDQFNPINQSRYYSTGISLYDLHITTKSFNVEELRQAGAVAVVFQDNGFDATVFHPRDVSNIDRQRVGAQVGFIGEYERERAESFLYLARHDVPVRVWGSGWKGRLGLNHSALKIEGKGLWDEDYTLAICATDINLCFLRKANRDMQTTRSIEIPACGGFMLAERTDEHRRLFEEDKEAVFFSSNDELLEKVRYYAKHEDERNKIAKAGLSRCYSGGYSFEDRFKWLVQEPSPCFDGVRKEVENL
jgi:spore maturation protein CgeB